MLMLPVARAGIRQEVFPSYIDAQHRVVLEKWLKQKPYLRPATTEDLDAEFLKRVKDMFPESTASPFYTTGDFNHDDQKDFAVGLVNKNKPGTLAIAVFNGPLGKANAPAFYEENKFELTDIIFLGTDGRNRDELQIGIGSDTKTVLLKPKGRSYYIWEGATQ
jgi:hypothetical protein